ncbi:hypothetical protein [Ramlibacter sp.]|uniref:hypothetical protein n=1 Tax=Ramlibacter sp. TaxID=1917967 RepID=UPI003D14359D
MPLATLECALAELERLVHIAPEYVHHLGRDHEHDYEASHGLESCAAKVERYCAALRQDQAQLQEAIARYDVHAV